MNQGARTTKHGDSDDDYEGPERRKKLTPAEIEDIKQQLLDSIYADIGKSVVKKFLWVAGSVGAAAFAWLNWPGPHR